MVTVLAAVLATAASVGAVGDAEQWQDDAGSGQGVGFSRDVTHTHVPKFFDQRPASFTCSDGQGYDDPLVVVAAGNSAGDDLPVTVAPDGSFSYDGQAVYGPGTAHMAFQGRFTSDTAAAGTVHWTVSRQTNSGTTCSADSGVAQWTAHCASSCGGASGGGITVTMSGRPVIGQWALVDVQVTSSGTGRIVAFAHHAGTRACGSFTAEDGAAAQKGRHGPVERLGDAQVPGAGSWVFHSKYIPDQFGKPDRICAFLTEAPAGTTTLASGEGTPTIGFALPWTGRWSPLGFAAGYKAGAYSFGTPEKRDAALRGTAPGMYITGTWGCDGGIPKTNRLAGRRWWFGPASFDKALRITPIKMKSDGSFSYSSSAYPDFSNNYDSPIPMKWPSHAMHATVSGRFTAGVLPFSGGQGVVKAGTAKLTVVNGSRRCATRFKFLGQGALSSLPAKTDAVYSGTLTAG